MTFHQTVFVDETVILDGNSYVNCIFRGCRLVYAGGSLPTLAAPSFRDCDWELTDTAARVLILLRGLQALGTRGPSQQAVDYIRGGAAHLGFRVVNN